MIRPSRRHLALAGLSVAAIAALLVPVLAHEGHDDAPSSPFDLDSPRRPSEQTAANIGLKTAEVDFGRVEQIVRLTGTVRLPPDRLQAVSVGVAGTLVQLLVKVGDTVKAGQPVAIVQSAELARFVYDMHKAEVEFEHLKGELESARSSLAQLRAQVAAAEQQAKLAEDESRRVASGAEAVSANILAQKQGAAIQARAQVTTLEISLQTQQRTILTLERMELATQQSISAMRDVVSLIHAHPAGIDEAEEAEAERQSSGGGGAVRLHARFDGVVTRIDAVVGQGVEPGRPVLHIADYRSVLIEGELPESLIPRFASSRGQSVRIRRSSPPSDLWGAAAADDDSVLTGRVKGVSPTIDPVKRTAHLLIEAENPVGPDPAVPALQEGMFVRLAVVMRETADAVVVPSAAIVTDGPMTFVFVKDGDAYLKRDVVAGAGDDRLTEIKDGLVPGDVVVVQGAYALSQLRPRVAPAAHEDHDHAHPHSH